MHTTETSSMYFVHNGDYSGLIHFNAPDPDAAPDEPQGRRVSAPFFRLVEAALSATPGSMVTLTVFDGDGPDWRHAADFTSAPTRRVTIPATDLRELLGSRLVGERVSALEQMELLEACALATSEEIATWSVPD